MGLPEIYCKRIENKTFRDEEEKFSK